jgi:hypothetical protein
MPDEIKYDANATPPQFTNNADMVIEPGTHVRVKIIGLRTEVSDMWAIGSINGDFLGFVSPVLDGRLWLQLTPSTGVSKHRTRPRTTLVKSYIRGLRNHGCLQRANQRKQINFQNASVLLGIENGGLLRQGWAIWRMDRLSTVFARRIDTFSTIKRLFAAERCSGAEDDRHLILWVPHQAYTLKSYLNKQDRILGVRTQYSNTLRVRREYW